MTMLFDTGVSPLSPKGALLPFVSHCLDEMVRTKKTSAIVRVKTADNAVLKLRVTYLGREKSTGTPRPTRAARDGARHTKGQA